MRMSGIGIARNGNISHRNNLRFNNHTELYMIIISATVPLGTQAEIDPMCGCQVSYLFVLC